MTYSGAPYSGAPYSGTSSSAEPVETTTEGITLTLSGFAVSGAARTRPGTYPNPADAPGYVVKLVDSDGTVIETLERANPKSIVWTLNEAEDVSIELGKYDPKVIAHVAPLSSQVQIFRNDDLKAWVRLIDDAASTGSGAITFPARGPWWIFSRRFFGTANRRNMIRNASFETGPAAGTSGAPIPGWAQIGAAATHYSATSRPDLPAPNTGTKAVAFYVGAGANAYLRSRTSYRTDFPPGQRVTVAAWVYVDEWVGPAALGLGLYLGWNVAGAPVRTAAEAIDDSTPRGQWTRLETSLIVPPGDDGVLEVRCYAPGGLVAWDSSRMALMESTGSGFAGADQVELAATAVRYGQTGRGKSDEGIGTRVTPTGVVRRRAWQHEKHEWIDSAVADLAALPDGFDFSVEITPRTKTFVTHYPRQGTDRRSTLTLTPNPGPGRNLASASRSRSGGSVATSVVSKSTFSGPTREEGYAFDPTRLDGLVLEDLAEAPDDLPIEELDDHAAAELETRKELVAVWEAKLPASADLFDDGRHAVDVLEVGDLARLVIDDGYLSDDVDVRIVRIALECPTDSLTLTLNRWETVAP